MPAPGDLLTVSRQDLYELVWSKPMIELAKDFGLSDVALAKRCRRLGVPVPGRGYWARIAAGQTPRRPDLPKRDEEAMENEALTFEPPREESATVTTQEATELSVLREKLSSMQLPHAEDLRSSSPPVKRTAVRLKRPWRNEICWGRGERQGTIVSVDVSEMATDRALDLCERIIAAASAVGWTFKTPPKEPEDARSYRYRVGSAPGTPVFGCLDVHGEALAFRIEERRKRIEHELTKDEEARRRRGLPVYPPRWDYIPTGELRIHMMHPGSKYTVRTWKDGARKRVEDQIHVVLLGLLDEALRIKSRREEERVAEIERQRVAKLRCEQSERRAANAKLVHELEAQAGAWLRARFLRSYLRALRRAAGTRRIEAQRRGETIDFLAWAHHYVDQLDPLSCTPHDADLKADRPAYYAPDDSKWKDSLKRLIGCSWEDAFKLEASDPEDPEGLAESLGSEDEDLDVDDAEAFPGLTTRDLSGPN